MASMCCRSIPQNPSARVGHDPRDEERARPLVAELARCRRGPSPLSGTVNRPRVPWTA
jgi:hypothetical protein